MKRAGAGFTRYASTRSSLRCVAVCAACILFAQAQGWSGESAMDRLEFVSIFNGKDLTGWDGDPRFWSVKDGAIRGETTAEASPSKDHSYLIWRGETVGDFELRLQFRILSGNSGVQFRSKETGKWVLSGYQAEIVPEREYMGSFYEVKGRQGLAMAGRKILITERGEMRFVGTFGDADVLRERYKETDWNDMTIIARNNQIVQLLNGTVMSEIVDEQPDGRALSGLLGFQLHAGPPMVVEYKDIRIKRIEPGAELTLFNGKDLSGWEVKDEGFFMGHGKVEVVDGEISIGSGAPMSGIGWTGFFPRDNYEISLEGKRVAGGDFFAGVTFPVADSYVTLICGGWGGWVVGLSNIDDMNASENMSSLGREFEMNRWYKIRVSVTPEKIQVWIDEDKVIDVDREGHRFAVWPEQEPIRPFGVSTYDTGSRLRNITLHRLK